MVELVVTKIATAIVDPLDFTSATTLDFTKPAYFNSTYLDYMYDSPI